MVTYGSIVVLETVVGGARSPPPTDQLMTVSTSTTRSRPGATDSAVQTLLDNSPYQPLLDKITYMSYVLW